MTTTPSLVLFKTDYRFIPSDSREIKDYIAIARNTTIDSSRVSSILDQVSSRMLISGRFQCQARFDIYKKPFTQFALVESYRFFDKRNHFMSIVSSTNKELETSPGRQFEGTPWDALTELRGREVTSNLIDWEALSKSDKGNLLKESYVSHIAKCILLRSEDTVPRIHLSHEKLTIAFDNVCNTNHSVLLELTA